MLSYQQAIEATAKPTGAVVVVTAEELARRAREAAAIAPKDFRLYP